jgi:hypothetical protein
MEDGSFLKETSQFNVGVISTQRLLYLLVLPIIILWVVGFPLYIFIQLFRARYNLNKRGGPHIWTLLCWSKR